MYFYLLPFQLNSFATACPKISLALERFKSRMFPAIQAKRRRRRRDAGRHKRQKRSERTARNSEGGSNIGITSSNGNSNSRIVSRLSINRQRQPLNDGGSRFNINGGGSSSNVDFGSSNGDRFNLNNQAENSDGSSSSNIGSSSSNRFNLPRQSVNQRLFKGKLNSIKVVLENSHGCEHWPHENMNEMCKNGNFLMSTEHYVKPFCFR